MAATQAAQILSKYMPQQAVSLACKLLDDYPCHFRITKPRKSKLGDYRPPFRNQNHKISVNGNLNHYAFLLTYVHEFAHMAAWLQYKDEVKPHGEEWKRTFRTMMRPFLELKVFPPDVEIALKNYLNNPAAASCSDVQLLQTLRKYDTKRNPNLLVLQELPADSHFAWRDGRVFKKMEKLRKRYRCMEVKTRKLYLFSPMAEVVPVRVK